MGELERYTSFIVSSITSMSLMMSFRDSLTVSRDTLVSPNTLFTACFAASNNSSWSMLISRLGEGPSGFPTGAGGGDALGVLGRQSREVNPTGAGKVEEFLDGE